MKLLFVGDDDDDDGKRLVLNAEACCNCFFNFFKTFLGQEITFAPPVVAVANPAAVENVFSSVYSSLVNFLTDESFLLNMGCLPRALWGLTFVLFIK